MQVLASMSVLRPHDTPPELLALLLQVVPEGRFRATPKDKEGFKLDLPETDPRVNQVLMLLKDHGYTQVELPDARQRQYRLIRRRRYEPSDIAAAPFCWLEYCEVKGSTDGERTNNGLLRLPHADVGEWEQAVKIGPTLVVLDAVKRGLEGAGYAGLEFRQTVQTMAAQAKRATRGAVSQGGQPGEPVPHVSPECAWWELASDTCIGPMLNIRRLALTGQREPLPSGTQGPGTLVNEENFNDFRPVFARSAIDAVAKQDIVHTWEFVFRAHEPEILVSCRLREAVHAVQPACRWVPVEVVED